MKPVLLACVAITYLTTAYARDLAPVMDDQDQQTLVQALDALMKAQGLTSLTNGTAAAVQKLFQKLQAAAQAPDPQPPKPGSFGVPVPGSENAR